MDFFLADDLSGALDAAAAFHHAGQRVRIVLSAEDWAGQEGDEVIGVTTETRNATPAVAAAAVSRALAHGAAQGARLLYKKIDSTLRGPVAAELAAVAAAMPGTRILFTPANPRVGRIVRDGVLLVHGVPVTETEFAHDPMSPVKESVIRRLLGAVAAVDIVIADAVTEDDLAAAVARMDANGEPWVAVGSGALARPVAARRSGDRGQGTGDNRRDGGLPSGPNSPTPVSRPLSPDPRPLSAVPGRATPVPCLMVCGSAHAGNRAQAAVLARERGVAIHELRVDRPAVGVDAALADFRANRGAAIIIEERRGRSAEVIRTIVVSVAQIVKETKVSRVFVTGGETAFALCNALEISTLAFSAEIETGLSLSRAGNASGAVWLAIKPGGFGDAHTWVRAWDALVVT